MDTASFLSLVAFTVVGSGTPGPNNLMVMASGANFGLRRTGPHILGIALGFAAMVLLTGWGLAGAMATVPWLRGALLVVSAAFLLYLAWKIATAAPPDPADPPGRPLSFLGAAAFQWVNPKAWAIALSTVTVYAPGSETPVAALVFALVSLPLLATWCVAGETLGRYLSSDRALVIFNRTMAGLLLLSLLPALA